MAPSRRLNRVDVASCASRKGRVVIVSIMQPYFFPYVGYFQLIAESDIFVFHDDVQYIKGGWVNRNRIVNLNGDPVWLTLPVAAAGHKLNINERLYIINDKNQKIIQ